MRSHEINDEILLMSAQQWRPVNATLSRPARL
jgi:hypothetical protein